MEKLNEHIEFLEMTEDDPQLLVWLLELRRNRENKWQQRAEAAEAKLEIGYKWRDLALQFDGHRMQALSLLKMIVNDAPVEQYQSARNFLNSPPLSGEDIMKERIAAIAGRGAPAINLAELVPEGWKLVPVEPTTEMLEEIWLDERFKEVAMKRRYQALLAAAPTPHE